MSSVASETRPGHGADDVRPSDITLGFLTALAALGITVMSIYSAEVRGLDEDAPAQEEGEIVVEIEPVYEAELEAAGDDTIPVSPQPRPKARPVPPRPADAPPPSSAPPERPTTGIRGLPRVETPTHPPLVGLDDLLGLGPGGPEVPPGDADPETSPKDPYAYVDPAQENPGAESAGAVGEDDGEGGGDPLAARAVAAYRQRIQRWLSVHFFVTDSGLSREQLRKAKIRATLIIDDNRVVIDHSIQTGGHPALEAAARRALDRVKGQPLPEPPQHYPGPLQRSISVTFTCTEATCN